MRTICISNQQGGVGKTTTAVNLAASLAKSGKSVLLIDLDPQGNASSGLGLKSEHEFGEKNIYRVLIGQMPIREAIAKSSVNNLDAIVANSDLIGAEIELVDAERREYRLKEALSTLDDSYQFAIIDCPPSLGLLTVNALTAANTFLVPLQCEYYALEGFESVAQHRGPHQKAAQPRIADRRNRFDDVRCPQQFKSSSGERNSNTLRRKSFQLDHSPQRAVERGAEPR